MNVHFVADPTKPTYIGRLVVSLPECLNAFSDCKLNIEDARPEDMAAAFSIYGDVVDNAVSKLMQL
jgi:hypothetical protein